MRKGIAIGLLAAYLALLIHLTLFRYRVPHADRNFVPLRSIRHDLRNGGEELRVNLLGNLAAFAPIGLIAPMLPGRWGSARRVALLGFGLSLAIETLQGYSGHRVADVDDLILNTIGGLIGLGLWAAGRRLLGRRPPPPGPDRLDGRIRG